MWVNIHCTPLFSFCRETRLVFDNEGQGDPRDKLGQPKGITPETSQSAQRDLSPLIIQKTDAQVEAVLQDPWQRAEAYWESQKGQGEVVNGLDALGKYRVDFTDPKDEASMSQQKEAVAKMAKQLYQRTQARVNGADDFDWDHAETVVDPNKMKAVTVQVPEFVHGRFVTNVKATLTRISDLKRIQNPRIDDPQARAENLKRQFDTTSTVGYQKAGERR